MKTADIEEMYLVSFWKLLSLWVFVLGGRFEKYQQT